MPRIGLDLIGLDLIGRAIGFGLGLAIGRGLGLDILIGAGRIGAERIGAERIGAIRAGPVLYILASFPGSLRIAPLCFIGDDGLVSLFLGRFTGVPGAFPASPYA